MEANANLQPGGVIGPNQQPQPQNNIMEDDAVNGLVLEGNLPADPAPPEILENNAPAPGQVRPILELFCDHLGPFFILFLFVLQFFQICIKWFNLYQIIQTWLKLFQPVCNFSNLSAIVQTCLKLIKLVWSCSNRIGVKLSILVWTYLNWYIPVKTFFLKSWTYPEHILIIILFSQGAGNLNNANANELNVGDDGQWNPMEWDR